MSATRRLLWINHYAIPLTEGGGTRHAEIGRELNQLGWDVTIEASDFHLQTRKYTRRSGEEARDPIVEKVSGVTFVWLWTSAYRSNDWRRARNWVTFARS